jgi:hypothetical protein
VQKQDGGVVRVRRRGRARSGREMSVFDALGVVQARRRESAWRVGAALESVLGVSGALGTGACDGVSHRGGRAAGLDLG